MASGKKNNRRNVVFSLRNRELRLDKRCRTDFGILKTLIVHIKIGLVESVNRVIEEAQSKREFKKVWSKQSSKMFTYEGGYLFSDNYRIGYSGYTTDGGLKQQFRLPSVDVGCKNKIEEVILYKCYHENFHKFENRPSFIGILSRRMGESLVQYDLNTGQLIREIFLSHTVKFRHISWVEGNEMFVVKSINTAARSRFHMVTGIPVNVAIVMAVFKAFPLEFVGMFEVDRRIFGVGITSAILSHSLLIVMHVSGYVKCYSFPYILQHFKVSDHNIDEDQTCSSNIQDHCPYGASLPINIKITECPPALFEVKCADHDVQIGGFPWHYIFTPHGSQGTFSVYNVKTGKKAKNGTLHTQCLSVEPDQCVFHDDNSGRIVHISSPEIRILEIKSENDNDKTEVCPVKSFTLEQESTEEESPYTITSSGRLVKRKQSLEEIDSSRDLQKESTFTITSSGRLVKRKQSLEEIDSSRDLKESPYTITSSGRLVKRKQSLEEIDSSRDLKKESTFTITSSGRLVKRKQSLEEIDPSRDLMIHQMQYEDELDVTWVSATHYHPATREVVCFYDNQTFEQLREIQLSERGEETYQVVTYVDLDTIIQTQKRELGKFVCTVYRLSGDQQPDQDKSVCKDSKQHCVQGLTRRTTRSRRS